MGQPAAQKRRRFHAVGYRRPQVKEDQVAARFRRFLDRGRAIVYRAAHFVGGCRFDEIPNSAAHGGTLVHNEQSGPARAGHKREKILRFAAKHNMKIRIFPSRCASKKHGARQGSSASPAAQPHDSSAPRKRQTDRAKVAPSTPGPDAFAWRNGRLWFRREASAQKSAATSR